MANEKHRRAFISYSRINKEFATRLVKGLRAEGYPVWFDLLDIPTGSRWDDEVEKALRECSIFMIILTPASIASENVKDEIGYAIDHGKRILPVLLEDCDVPLRLRRFQYVDFTTKSFEEGFESAKDLLGDLIDEASTPLPPKAPAVESQVDQNAEDERLAKQKAENEQFAQVRAKEEADRLATEKASAVLLAKQKADDDLTTKAKAETEHKAREETDRLAAQKVESERVAKQKADDEWLVQSKAETERKAKEEAERLAAQKAEADRKAKEKAEPIAVPATTQKKPRSKGLVIGIVAVVVLCIAGVGIGFSALSNPGTPATEALYVAEPATEAPAVAEPATEAPAADTPACPWESNQSVQVLFENQSSLVIDYYWVDFDCTRQYFGVLAPGETVTLDTYVSHDWQFLDQQTGSIYAEYQADTNGYFAIPANEASATEPTADPNLIFSDDFSDPNNSSSNWGDVSPAYFENEKFYIVTTDNATFYRFSPGIDFSQYGSDLAVVVSATSVSNGSVGIYSRSPGNVQTNGPFYLFQIDFDLSQATIWYYDGENWENLATQSVTQSSSYGLVVVCAGNSLDFYVNGENVHVNDDKLAEAGQVGLYIQSSNPSGSTIEVDDFYVGYP